MRPTRLLLAGFLGVLLVGPASAEPLRSPLHLVPGEADFVVQVPDARNLLETVLGLDIVKRVKELEGVKEGLDSTQSRRLFQLIGHFERRLEMKLPDLLEQLAGGGAVLGLKFGDKPPVLIAVQSKDEKLMRRFVDTALEVIEEELARQESKDRPVRGEYLGCETIRIGQGFHAAVEGGALLVSNREEGLKKAIDLARGKSDDSMAKHGGPAEAVKLLPAGKLASFWLNMEPVRKQPGFEAIYKTPRDPGVTVAFGGWADLLGRSPYLSGALCHQAGEMLLTARMPVGSDGMGPDKAVNCPPEGQPASRPLLMPKNTLFSSTYYYDISRFWTDRVTLFGKDRAETLEQFDEQSSRFLSTVGFSKLLTATGPYQRIVAAHQEKGGYKKQPRTVIPSFAFVVELRKPEEFRKGVETGLRAAGLFATTQVGLRMTEEKHKGCDIIVYRFDEEKDLKNDPDGFRFNFSPCFTLVGDQYIVASTVELCRELVGLLQDEKGKPATRETAHSLTVFPAAGGKALLEAFRDQIVTSAILGQAFPLDEAKAQAQAFLDLFDHVEGLEMTEHYGAKRFHLDLRLKFPK